MPPAILVEGSLKVGTEPRRIVFVTRIAVWAGHTSRMSTTALRKMSFRVHIAGLVIVSLADPCIVFTARTRHLSFPLFPFRSSEQGRQGATSCCFRTALASLVSDFGSVKFKATLPVRVCVFHAAALLRRSLLRFLLVNLLIPRCGSNGISIADILLPSLLPRLRETRRLQRLVLRSVLLNTDELAVLNLYVGDLGAMAGHAASNADVLALTERTALNILIAISASPLVSEVISPW